MCAYAMRSNRKKACAKPKNKITKDDRERIDENPKTNETKTNKSKKKKNKKLDDTVAQLAQL